MGRGGAKTASNFTDMSQMRAQQDTQPQGHPQQYHPSQQHHPHQHQFSPPPMANQAPPPHNQHHPGHPHQYSGAPHLGMSHSQMAMGSPPQLPHHQQQYNPGQPAYNRAANAPPPQQQPSYSPQQQGHAPPYGMADMRGVTSPGGSYQMQQGVGMSGPPPQQSPFQFTAQRSPVSQTPPSRQQSAVAGTKGSGSRARSSPQGAPSNSALGGGTAAKGASAAAGRSNVSGAAAGSKASGGRASAAETAAKNAAAAYAKMLKAHQAPVLQKRTLQSLVEQVDRNYKLDADVEEVLQELADDFIETVTTFGCILAKHRHSSSLQPQDLQLHLQRNWHMPRIPGFSTEEIAAFRSKPGTETHKQRLHVLRRSFAAAAAAEAVAHAQQASAAATAQASKASGSKSGGGSSKPPAKVRVVE